MAIVKLTTPWKHPLIGENLNQPPAGNANWLPNASAITATDGNFTTAAVPTQWLIARDFLVEADFAQPTVTIVGVEVRTLRSAVGADEVVDGQVRLFLDGNLSPTIKVAPDSWSPATNGLRYDYFGGDGDLWGETSVDKADLLLATTGWRFWADTPDKSATAQVDSMEMRVYYEFDDGVAEGEGPGYDGTKTLIENSVSVNRPLNVPFQPNTLLDAFCRYTVEMSQTLSFGQAQLSEFRLMMGPSHASLQEIDYQRMSGLLTLLGGLLTITLAKADTKSVAAIVPSGWWVELRVADGQTVPASYTYLSGLEQSICVHDVKSVLWTTDRDPATAPETTSHKSGDIVIAFTPTDILGNKLVKL